MLMITEQGRLIAPRGRKRPVTVPLGVYRSWKIRDPRKSRRVGGNHQGKDEIEELGPVMRHGTHRWKDHDGRYMSISIEVLT